VSGHLNGTSTALVEALKQPFHGIAGALGSTMAQMHALRIESRRLLLLVVPDIIGIAGPRFADADTRGVDSNG